MKTKLDKTSIRRLFAKHAWPFRLSVNGWPVNHHGFDHNAALVKFYPDGEETPRRTLRRFVASVERAAERSLGGPTILSLAFVEVYPEPVLERLISLLRWSWAPNLARSRFIVNLGLDLLDPATPGAVDRIIGS